MESSPDNRISKPNLLRAKTRSNGVFDGVILLVIAALCCIFWQSPALIPLKILVVFFHEASHALMTLATGGTVLAMRIVPEQGGEVLSLGGVSSLIISAGYLGSLSIGAGLLIAASRSTYDRVILALLGAAMAALTLFFMKGAFGIAFGLVGATLALGVAYFLPAYVSDFLLKLIGLVSMIYVPLDIFSDTLARAHLHSDARILAEHLGGTTQIWGAVWLLISVPVTLFALWISFSLKEASAS